MKKQILFSNGVVKLMSFDEVLEQFQQMIYNFSHKACQKMQFNKPDFEDVVQECRIQTWHAFEKYNSQNAFSTYLFYRLKLAISKTFGQYSGKKREHNGILPLFTTDSSNQSEFDNSGISIDKFIGHEDEGIAQSDFSFLLETLEKTLTEQEFDIVKCLIDKKEYPVAKLAEKWGVTRAGANQRVNSFRKKLATMLRDTEYVTI